MIKLQMFFVQSLYVYGDNLMPRYIERNYMICNKGEYVMTISNCTIH